MKLLIAALLYPTILAIVWLVNKREFARSPEKGARYRALPLGYKLACWFGIIPLIAAAIFEPALVVVAMAGFAILEALCVRWYRKHGLLPSEA